MTVNAYHPMRQRTFTKSARHKDQRVVDLICDALPFDRLLYGGPNAVSNAIGYMRSITADHIMPWFACMITLAT
jgi:hypothetical protein